MVNLEYILRNKNVKDPAKLITISLRVIINGKPDYINTNEKCRLADFINDKDLIIKPTADFAAEKNFRLSTKLMDLRKKLTELDANKVKIDFNLVKMYFEGSSKTFVQIANEILDEEKISENSKIQYRSALLNFDIFKKDVQIKHLTVDLIQEYADYLHKNNFSNQYYAGIRRFFPKLIKKKLLKSNPSESVEISKYEKKSKDAITYIAIQKIQELIASEQIKDQKMKLIVIAFNFILNTGVRISDLVTLQDEHFIFNASKKIYYIRKNSVKGNQLFMVPLNSIATEIYLKYIKGDNQFKDLK